MFLKRRVRHKDGKDHVYDSVCESLRIHNGRTIQCQILHLAELTRLYRCLDHLASHKQALEQHLATKWKDLFGADFDIVLYDLTSTYFEGGAGAIKPNMAKPAACGCLTAASTPGKTSNGSGNAEPVTTLSCPQTPPRCGQTHPGMWANPIPVCPNPTSEIDFRPPRNG